MTNPITRVREDRGLGRRAFALALGVSYNAVHSHEQGLPARVQPAILEGLKRLGINTEHVARDYVIWREQRRQEVLRDVVGV